MSLSKPAQYLKAGAIQVMMKQKLVKAAKSSSDFRRNDPNGINCIRGLVLASGKTNPKAQASSIFLMVGSYKKSDFEKVPPFAARWNDEAGCIEFNVRKHFTKGAKPKSDDFRKYFPEKESDFIWAKLPMFTVIELADFDGKISQEHEWGLVRIGDLFPGSVAPDKVDANKDKVWFKPYSWKYGNIIAIENTHTIPPQLRPRLVEQLPYLPFAIQHQANLATVDRRALSVIQVIPSYDTELLEKIMAHPRWSYCALQAQSDPKMMTYADKEHPNYATNKVRPEGTVVTAWTIGDGFLKTIALDGIIQQKERAASRKVLTLHVQLRGWKEQAQIGFEVDSPDIWTALMGFIHAAHFTAVCTADRGRSRGTNADANAGEDDEDDLAEEVDEDALLAQEEGAAKSGSDAAGKQSDGAAEAAAAPMDEDALLNAAEDEAAAAGQQSGVDVSGVKICGALSFTILRIIHDLSDFLDRYGFRVPHEWPTASTIAGVGKDGKPAQVLRKIFTRSKTAKKLESVEGLSALKSIVCASEFTPGSMKHFISAAKDGKGEFRVIPECTGTDDMLPHIKTLTMDECVAVLEGRDGARFKLQRPAVNPMYVIYFINRMAKPLAINGKPVDMAAELKNAVEQFGTVLKQTDGDDGDVQPASAVPRLTLNAFNSGGGADDQSESNAAAAPAEPAPKGKGKRGAAKDKSEDASVSATQAAAEEESATPKPSSKGKKTRRNAD